MTNPLGRSHNQPLYPLACPLGAMTDTGAAAAAAKKPVDDGKERAVMTKVGRRSDFGWEDRGWKFTSEELANPPSVDKSINVELWRQVSWDKDHRSQAHGLVFMTCMTLRAKAVVIAGAMTIYQRFLAQVSYKKSSMEDTAAAVILLASKVEDYRINIRDVLYAIHKVATNAALSDDEYKPFKDRVVKIENNLMRALGFDFLIEHAYPHATDLIQHLCGMGWVPEDKVALISKGCCHLLSQSLKWTMCLEYPPTFRARLAAYVSLLVNHVPPPPSGEWVEILQFEDPEQLKRVAYQLLHTLDNDKGKTSTKITYLRVSKALSKAFPSELRTHASTNKRKRLEADVGTTNDTTQKRSRPRPPLPRGLPPSNARSSSSWSSMSGPPATTKQPKTCTPRPPSTPKPRPPTTPKPRPPTTPKPRPPTTPKPRPPTTLKPRPPNTPKPRPPTTPKPRPPTTPKPRPPNTPKPHPPATPKPVKMTLTARPYSTPKPRPPSTPKPLKTSTPLPPNTPKPLKSFTPPPTNAPKPSLTLAARPPSTPKPRPPTTPKPRQTSTPNLLKKPAPTPPSMPKPLKISPPLPVSLTKPPVTPTPRKSSAPKPVPELISCAGPKPLSIPKGVSSVAPAGSPRLPSYGKAPRLPSTARPSPLGKAQPAKKPRPPPYSSLSAKTRLTRPDGIGASALRQTGAALDFDDGKRARNGGSSQMVFKAKGDAYIQSNECADLARGGGLDGKAMDRREFGMLEQDDRDNRKRSHDESMEGTPAATQGSGGKRPRTSSDSEGASGSEGDSTSTPSPGKADDTEDDEIEEGEIVVMANRPVFERACAA